MKGKSFKNLRDFVSFGALENKSVDCTAAHAVLGLNVFQKLLFVVS